MCDWCHSLAQKMLPLPQWCKELRGSDPTNCKEGTPGKEHTLSSVALALGLLLVAEQSCTEKEFKVTHNA